MVNLSFEKKILFIYISLAQSDSIIETDELKQIYQFTNDISGSNFSSKNVDVDSILNLVENSSLEEKQAFISNFLKPNPFNPDQTELFIQGMEEVIIADLDVKSDEMEMFRFIKHLITE